MNKLNTRQRIEITLDKTNNEIKEFSFLGLNSTIGHFVNIGKKCFVGSSAHITKNVKSNSIVVQNDSKKISFDPIKFLEINNFK